MNELRWILLAAGVILIAGLYLWGMRSRWQGRADTEATRRPVFTGGAKGFESSDEDAVALEGELDDDDVEPMRRDSRRVEPSFGDAMLDAGNDTESRRAEFLVDEDAIERPAIERREPTLSAVRAEPPQLSVRQEPTLRVEPEPVAPARVERELPVEPAAAAFEAPVRRSQKILAIRVSAITPSRFDGTELFEALRSEGLTFGRYEIFHRLHDDGRPIFSVASLKEPGTFDVVAMPSTQYPGVAMFAVLPGPVSAADAFDEMIFTARALATHLNGALADERGAPLTALRVGKLREEALDFERGSGPA
jgi:cell division protein ZipA